MSASEFARRVSVTPTAVWNWEKNGTQPRLDVLSRIAKVLGLAKESLISGSTEGQENAKTVSESADNAKTVSEVTDNARAQIAKLMGLPPERVKLQVHFETE